MFPQFSFLGKNISTYALIAVIATLVCGLLFCKIIKKRGLLENDAIGFLLFIIAGAIIGGHLLYALTNAQYLPYLFKKAEFSVFMARVQHIFGGSVFYGGLIGALASGLLAIKIMSLDIRIYSDSMAPIIPLFHGFARIGCFFAGCCYGIESSIGLKAENNPIIAEVNGVARFPVQLLESALNFALSLILFFLLKKSCENKKLTGKLLLIYLISYSVIRFFDEFLRGDEIRGFIFSLSVSQFISILIFVICGFLLVKISEKTFYNA